MSQQHPWSRYVALGDSFTEGIGDPEERSPGGHRGWADRVAEVLGSSTEDFAYANLAVRGRLLKQIIDEQSEAALALRPDLISVSAGGNDIIHPGTDPDEVFTHVQEVLPDTLAVLDKSVAEDNDSIVVTKETAAERSLTTIEDLAGSPGTSPSRLRRSSRSARRASPASRRPTG